MSQNVKETAVNAEIQRAAKRFSEHMYTYANHRKDPKQKQKKN